MEQVEIDIILNQNIDKEAVKAVKGFNEIASASDDIWKSSKEALELQRLVINRLRQELANLQKDFKKVNVSTVDNKVISQRLKLSKAIHSLIEELKGEEEALIEMEKRNEALANKQNTVLTQMRDTRNEMLRLKIAGNENTEEYKKQEQRLKTLALAHRELNKEQRALSKGGANLDGLMSGLAGLAGLVSVGGGGLGLLSKESKDFEKVQKTVQSAIAMTIGLQQIQNTIHKTSAFRIHILTKAKLLWSKVNIYLASTLGGATIMAKALTASLTLGLSVAITAIIGGISSYISKQKEAREELKKMNKAIADNSASQIASYEKLRKEYDKLGDDAKAKEKFILDHQGAFSGLGVSVESIQEADNLFIEQTENFKTAIKERASAIAAMDIAAEKYKLAIQKQLEYDNFIDVKTEVYVSRRFGTIRKKGNEDEKEKIKNEAEDLFADGDKWVDKSIQYNASAAQKLTSSSIEDANNLKYGTKAWWKAKKENAEARLEVLKDTEQGSKKWNKIMDEIREAEEKIEKFSPSKYKEQSIDSAKKSLRETSVKTQEEIDAAVISTMEIGREKHIKEIEASYAKRKEVIEARKKEIEELEKLTGVDGSKQKEELGILEDKEKIKYDNSINIVNKGSEDALNQMWGEVNSRFRSENENRLLDLKAYYKRLFLIIKQNAKSKEDFERKSRELRLQEDKETELLKAEMALKELDFRNEIKINREILANEETLLETDKEEKILKVHISSLKERLSKLNEIKKNGGDVDDDIERTKLAIDNMNRSLSEMPLKRLNELSKSFKSMFVSISKVGGDMGAVFSELANGVDDVMQSLNAKSTIDKVSAGMNGLVKLYSIAKNQLEENARAQSEWNTKIQEAEHKMRLMRVEALEYKEANLFGVENPYTRAIKGAERYRQVMIELNSSINVMQKGYIQTGTKRVISGKNIAAGAAAGAAIGSVIPGILTAVGAIVGGVLGGIFGGTRKKLVPVFNSISDEFGSILKNGTKTFELNPRILENYSKLDTATKKIVDNWEELRKKAIEAEKEINDTFKSLAGDLGSALSSSLAAGFRNKDMYAAVDEFQNKITGTIEKIIEQMIFASHFKGYFDELQKRMKDSVKEGGDNDIVDDIIWFSKVYKQGLVSYQKDMEEAKKTLKEEGINVFANNTDDRKAARRGLAQASQDSIDELQGMITFISMSVGDVKTISADAYVIEKENLDISRSMLSYLSAIAANTEHCKALSAISSALEKINKFGLSVKR